MPERVAGVPLPESSGSYTRRHFFVVGIACVLSLQLGVGWSRILDRAMLVASLIALVLTSLGEAGYNGRVRQRRWFFVLGTGAAVVFSSWRAQRLGSLLHGSSFFLEHAAQLKQSRRFRNILFSRHDIRETDLQKVLLPPTDVFYQAGAAIVATEDSSAKINGDLRDSHGKRIADGGASSFLSAMDDHFRDHVYPSVLLEESSATPLVAKDAAAALIPPVMSDIVLLVFGGVLQEFIDKGPFEKLFMGNTESVFARQEWVGALEKARLENPALAQDPVWSLEELSTINMDMDKLFGVASVDDPKSGQPLFRCIRFLSPFGSLESIGTLHSTTSPYIRRMAKLHTLLTSIRHPSQPRNINPAYVFVGYSRGALLALDVLARATRQQHTARKAPWLARVRGVVSLGGPVLGAEGADFANAPGHLFHTMLDPIRAFGQKLDFEHEGDAGSFGHAKEIFKNSVEFLKLGFNLAQMNKTKLSKRAVRSAALFEHETDEAGVPLPKISIMTDGFRRLLFERFKLHNPVGEYYENIKRVKIFVAAMIEGVRDLSTQSRLAWWSDPHNFILKGVPLFAIPATMPGAGEPTENLENSVLYSRSSKSTDWWCNRMFYYANFGDTGKQCQDGQVSCDRAVFWPRLLERLNARYKGRETGVLAVLGSHHWGLALPFVLDGEPDGEAPSNSKTEAGGSLDDVPRSAVLDAIGAMFVMREREKEIWIWDEL